MASNQSAAKSQNLTVVLKSCAKSALKSSIEKPVLLNFVNLSKFCPKLWNIL